MPGLLDAFLNPAGDKAAQAAAAAQSAAAQSTPPADPPPVKQPVAFDDLDSFLEIVQTAQQSGTPGSDEVTFDLGILANNQDAMNAVASKMNFLGALPPDLVAKLKEGDANAFMQAIEHVGRQSYANALRHSTILVAEALKGKDSNLPKKMQTAIKAALEERDLDSALPAESHKTTQAVLKATADSIRAKHPELSAAEALNAARNMLSSVVDNLNGRLDSSGKPVTPKGKINWNDWAKG